MENNDIILDDQFHGQEPKELVHASKGKRFANYIIDRICWTALFFILGLALGASGNLEAIEWLENINPFADFLLTAFVAMWYYTLMEYFTNGKTIGKYITRTRVVGERGERLSFMAILGRSAARFVPFEPFSFLGNSPWGWHDTWSKTYVMEDPK